MKKNKTKNNNKGITLVALVVTIVVLLILAGITITMLFSDNGIIKKAQEAKNETENAEQTHKQGVENLTEQMKKNLGNYSLDDIKKSVSKLKEKYVEADNKGILINGEDEINGFLEVQNKINNSEYKNKIANVNGNLVYLGTDEEEKKVMEENGVNVKLSAVINNMNKNLTYEEGYIRVNPKKVWNPQEEGSITEEDIKRLVANSENVIEQDKITLNNPYGDTLGGTQIYYNGELLGTLITNAQIDGKSIGSSNVGQLSGLWALPGWEKAIKYKWPVWKAKTYDLNNDYKYTQADMDILNGLYRMQY